METNVATAEVTQAELDEALMPELSDDFFYIDGHKVQIKPLKIRYQKEFAKAAAPITQTLAFEMTTNGVKDLRKMSPGDFCTVAGALLEKADVLPKLIQIMCHNDGHMLTDEQLDDSTLTIEQQQQIVVKQMKKAGELERKIADFFESVLPLVKKDVTRMLDEMATLAIEAEKKKEEEIEEVSLQTASSVSIA